MKLPHEEEGRAEVRAAFGAQLVEMGGLLDLASAVLTDGGITITKPQGLDGMAVRVTLGFFTKACKSYRAVILLCEAGLTEDAFVVARGLFETCVAVAWILQRSSRRRARMYVAHLSMRKKKMYLDWKRTKGVKRYATAAMMRAADRQIAEAAKVLSPQQMAGLAESYSGRSIRDTARVVRLLPVYQVFYRHASAFGHGSDLSSHLTHTPEGTPVLRVAPGYSPDMRRVATMSYALFRTLIETIDKRLGLGNEAAIATYPGILSRV